MARRLFFVDSIRRGAAEIRGDDAHHLTRVLRVEAGQQYEISDNQSLYLAEVETAHRNVVLFRVVERLPEPVPGPGVTLVAALIRFERFEWMVEKATELGVSAIVPVWTARTEKGLEHAAVKRVERWRKIALEASQQSRRSRLPVIENPCPLDGALGRESGTRLRLEEAGAAPILTAFSGREAVAILIGPEGGWTGTERAKSEQAGWTPVSLGPTILRTETAAIAAVAVASACSNAQRSQPSP